MQQNKRLKEEQNVHMKNLLKQNKDFEKRIDSQRVVDKEEVIEVMKEKWQFGRQESKALQGESKKFIENYVFFLY